MSGFLASMINPELVFTDLPCTDRQTFLQYISRRLEEKDYVKCSFEGAIIEREKKYPTGLPTVNQHVALPHTDVQHAKNPIIVPVKFRTPVVFKEMGNGINDIPCSMAFVLVVIEPEKQIDILQSLINLFIKKDFLEELYKEKTREGFLKRLLDEAEKDEG